MAGKILFTQKSLPFILEALGKKISEEGYVKNKNGSYVLDVDGKSFTVGSIIAIHKSGWITSPGQLLQNKKILKACKKNT